MEDNIDTLNQNENNVKEAKEDSTIFNIDKKSEENNLENNKKDNGKELTINNNNEKIRDIKSTDSNLKPKKEIPIEKKPFNEFVNDHLLPSLIQELNDRGFEVEELHLKNTSRPIAGDECWVIYCEIKDICNFWLSFEKEDISSLKSISLCKSNQKPSVIESFLIDEKRITLKLIISRILQRLNGQKLIGIN